MAYTVQVHESGDVAAVEAFILDRGGYNVHTRLHEGSIVFDADDSVVDSIRELEGVASIDEWEPCGRAGAHGVT